MKVGVLILVIVGALMVGCAAPVGHVRPVEARGIVLAHPTVHGWYVRHSAPAVLATMGPRQALTWPRYRPAMTVELVKEGLRVRMDAKFGPEPRHLEVLVDRTTGVIRSVTSIAPAPH